MFKIHKKISIKEEYASYYENYYNLSILYDAIPTKTKTIAPIIKSGRLEAVKYTNIPATITPALVITSVEVHIVLALM